MTSLIVLVIVNIISGLHAYFYGWDLLPTMCLFFGQSICIGAFSILKTFKMKKFTNKKGKIVNSNLSNNIFLVVFFLVHFGIFHIAYFTALVHLIYSGDFGSFKSIAEVLSLLFYILLFVFTEFFQYLKWSKLNESGHLVSNLGYLMGSPYLRIIPMHLVLTFYAPLGSSTILFLFFKGVADIIGSFLESKFEKQIPI